MSSSEDHKRDNPPDPPDDLDLGPGQSNTQGSAGFDQQHNPDPNQATITVSQSTTMAPPTVSQTSTMATTTVSQDTQATTTVSHPSAMATTAVSLQTTTTSTESQSTMGHITVSPSVGLPARFRPQLVNWRLSSTRSPRKILLQLRKVR